MDFQVYDIAIVPVIVALVAVFGQMGLPDRFKPTAALLLGLLAGFFYVAPGDPLQAIFIGIVMGLSAIGGYSGVKNTFRSNDDGLSESERRFISRL